MSLLYQFLTPGFDPTSLGTTVPSNSQLLQMVQEARPAPLTGMVIEADLAPDVVTYPDKATSIWHLTVAGVRTGYLYYYNGTAWTPMKVSPGTLTGDAFADNSINIDKLEPGVPYYVPQTNGTATDVVWVSAASLFGMNSFATGKLSYASGQDYFMMSDVAGAWSGYTKTIAANKISQAANAVRVTTFSDINDDGIMIGKAADNTIQTISHQQYPETLIGSLNPLTATAATDKVLVLDTSAAAGAKAVAVELSNLLPPSGVAAGTYSNVTVTVGANGLVTNISSGAAPTSVFKAAVYHYEAAAGGLSQDIFASAKTVVQLNASYDPDGVCTVPAANKLKFAATGTYLVDFTAPVRRGANPAKLAFSFENVSDTVVVASAGIELASAGYSGMVRLTQVVVVTDVTKEYEFFVTADTGTTSKMGDPANSGTLKERYQQVSILRIA